jgi:hypothetical protein
MSGECSEKYLKKIYYLLIIIFILNAVNFIESVSFYKASTPNYQYISFAEVELFLKKITPAINDGFKILKAIPEELEGKNLDMLIEAADNAKQHQDDYIVSFTTEQQGVLPSKHLGFAKPVTYVGECKDFLSCTIQGEGSVISNGKHTLYLDTSDKCKHIRPSGRCATIGYGINIDGAGNRQGNIVTFNKWGFNYSYDITDFKNAPQISNSEAAYLVEAAMNDSIDNAKLVLEEMGYPNCWENLGNGSPRQFVIKDMVYNMGINKVRKWTSTLPAICQGEYNKAAVLIQRTPYFRQVGGRAVRNIQMLETGKWHDKP